jgi:CHASE3 domain sensor protein
MNPKNRLSEFSRNLWLTLGMFVVVGITFGIYAYMEKQIDHANELRLQSYLLADQLRQSSDDLTRMVRTYVVTGDPIYKQHYQEIPPGRI